MYRDNPIKKQELIDQIAKEEAIREEKKVIKAQTELNKVKPKEQINYAAMFDSDSD
jgi:hypothetical protein